jgi:hypothetical protein
MTTARCVLGLLIVLVLGLSLPAAHANDADLSKLAWLGGCWKSESAEAGSGEHWLPLAGGTLLGLGRTVKEGKTVEFEFMQIRAGSDGKITFFAQPSGQSPASFPVLRLSETEVVFEDLQHDFPQRVAYRLDSKTHLTARIEGTRDGALRVIEFPMNRVSCDAPNP